MQIQGVTDASKYRKLNSSSNKDAWVCKMAVMNSDKVVSL